MSQSRSGDNSTPVKFPTIHKVNFTSAIQESRKNELMQTKPLSVNTLLESKSLPFLKWPSHTNTTIHFNFNTAFKEKTVSSQEPSPAALKYIYAATHGDYKEMINIEKKGLALASVVKHNNKLLLQAISAYCHRPKTDPNIEDYKNIILHLADYAKRNCKPEFLNAADKQGTTGLHLAANYNDLWLAQVLMDKGANNNLPNQLGYRPYELGKTTHKTQLDKQLKQLLGKNLIYLPTLGFNNKPHTMIAAEIPANNPKPTATKLPPLKL